MITKILPNTHVSPETAHVIESYPYGFKLRCKIRYWLETNKKGTRFCSQTTNPKKAGEVWNKPKASTYADFSGAMYLDENNHVQWEGLTQYADLPKINEFINNFGENATNFELVKNIRRKKEIFEEELGKFSPRPDYGSALYRSAYLAAVQRFVDEKLG